LCHPAPVRALAGLPGGKEMEMGMEKERPKGKIKPGEVRNPYGSKGKPKSPQGSDMVADMERAYNTAESPTDSPAVKAYRKLVCEDIGKFTMMVLKAKEAAGVKVTTEADGVATVAAEPAGENELRVGELIERLLGEWERGEAEA
jgi:hypothetical protein